MPPTVQAVIQQDLSRGSNLVTNPYVIGRQQSIFDLNMLLDEHASLDVRDGTLIQTSSPDAAPGIRPIIKLFDYIKQNGTIIRLAIVLGSGPGNQLYNRDTTPWTLLGTFQTAELLPDILTFTDLALIANGYEIPWSFDGTTLLRIRDIPGTGSTPQGAKHHTLHQGFYWLWNTKSASSGGTIDQSATLTTALAGANNDLTYVAVTPGAGGNAITIAYVNAGASQPLVVSVIGTAISVQLATDGGGAITSTADAVLAAVQAFPAAAALVAVSVAPGNNGTGLVIALAATALAGGVTGAANTVDGPSSLRSSDLNNPNSWPNANQVFIDKDDGDSGFGMGQFTIAETGISPATSQILFKAFSAYQMTGVFGSTNPVFAIQKIKSDMGCVAPRTIRFAPGFGLIRLTHRGFALFDGVDDRLISEEIRPLLFGTHGFVPIDWANAIRSYSCVVPNPPLYVCACPTSSGALTQVFIYDLVRRSWTVAQFANSIATLQTINNPGVLPVTLAGDFDHGGVRRMFADDPDDDGAPIGWEVALRPVSAPSPQQKGFYRRMILKVTNVVAGQMINGLFVFGPTGPSGLSREVTGQVVVPPGATQVTVPGDFGASYQVKIQTISNAPPPDWLTTKAVPAKTATSFTVIFGTPAPAAGGLLDYTVLITPFRSPRTKTRTITIPVSVGATAPSSLGYGVQQYGSSPYGGGTTLPPEIDLTYDLALIANNVRGLLSGQGRLTIRGIEWHVRSKPLSRPSVYV